MRLGLKNLQKMAKYFYGFVIALLLAGCGMSQEEKISVAAISCSVMSETRMMDGAVRVREMNDAREKIGGKAFLSGDDTIKESFELGLCETLVVDPDLYEKMFAAIEANERQKEEEERIARERAEEKRIARTRDALEEWKSAILDRINSKSDIIKDITFDVRYSDDYPVEIQYNCSSMQHLGHTLIVSFDNELGTLEGDNISGSCLDSNRGHSENLDLEDSDRENLYTVIGSKTKGSLFDSVTSVDIKISPLVILISRNAKERAEYKYADPTNFHPDLRGWDLHSSPITARIYDREEQRKNVAEKKRVAAEKRRVADNTPTVKEEFYSDGTLKDRSIFQSKNDGGKRHGSRERYYRNGQLKEKLNYVNGEVHGASEDFYEDGLPQLIASWKNGEQDGLWTSYYENGEIEAEINFKNGERDGLSTTYHENGEIGLKETYKNAEKDGLSTTYHENGEIGAEINFKNGERDGLSTLYRENGSIREKLTYKDGKRNGLGTMYFGNGEIEAEINFKNGERDGLNTSYYKNGEIAIKATYKNDVKDGLSTTYYENGEIASKANYKNDVKDGLSTTYYENGEIAIKATYKNDEKDGLSTVYHENGEIKFEGIYKNDKEDGLFVWFDENGKETHAECRMDGKVRGKGDRSFSRRNCGTE
jgi:antitoxin component YwqK of YwqJK toxin-antitoxin module